MDRAGQASTSDAAVLEAKLAVPYAMGELGAYAQSLELYNDAIGVFERERVSLDESIGAIRSGKLLDGLLERNPGEEEMGWFLDIDRLPPLPHAEHLAPVLARHDFQEAFKNYRDLLLLSKNLQQWRKSWAIYGDMLTTRRQALAEACRKCAGGERRRAGRARATPRRPDARADLGRSTLRTCMRSPTRGAEAGAAPGARPRAAGSFGRCPPAADRARALPARSARADLAVDAGVSGASVGGQEADPGAGRRVGRGPRARYALAQAQRESRPIRAVRSPHRPTGLAHSLAATAGRRTDARPAALHPGAWR